jgi:hypothetical protein
MVTVGGETVPSKLLRHEKIRGLEMDSDLRGAARNDLDRPRLQGSCTRVARRCCETGGGFPSTARSVCCMCAAAGVLQHCSRGCACMDAARGAGGGNPSQVKRTSAKNRLQPSLDPRREEEN